MITTKMDLGMMILILGLVGLAAYAVASRAPATPKVEGFADYEWRLKTPIMTNPFQGSGGPVKNLSAYPNEQMCSAACQNNAMVLQQSDRDPDYVMKFYQACREACRMNWQFQRTS